MESEVYATAMTVAEDCDTALLIHNYTTFPAILIITYPCPNEYSIHFWHRNGYIAIISQFQGASRDAA